jgi:N-acetylglucosaminyldiphosphoundecaprenol N-acetyl-beta-D-mannosaminyltransferase
MSQSHRVTVSVVGVPIDVLTWETALARINNWAHQHESRYVCICPVHSVVTARQDPEFDRVIREADMATPDGVPVAWLMRHVGYPNQSRIYGPDLMWKYCEIAERERTPVYFYGTTEKTLDLLRASLVRAFPKLIIAGMAAPPFRALTADEDEAATRAINESGAGVVFIGLGCPKQEKWMASHRGRITGVMIGVGAAFDFHSGRVQQAPRWMQDGGLEWLHRLRSEPRRLWRRYLVTNTIFIIAAARQLLSRAIRPDSAGTPQRDR